MSKRTDFNEFRFSGLNMKQASNEYLTMDRVSADENKIVVRVSDSHLLETRYGYALILDCSHVVFLKQWQVSANWFGNEVLLTREYFNVKEWGEFDSFGEIAENLSFDTWMNVAKEQDSHFDEDGIKLTMVRWRIKDK